MSTDLEVIAPQQIVAHELSVGDLLAQQAKIHDAMSQAMRPGVHYGNVPGVDKPGLAKAGAEILCVLFRLGPHYSTHETWHDDGHYTARVSCLLKHIPTGNEVGSADGLCSTREEKYAWRLASRVCPACGAEAIIKGREEYGGGWICFRKKGGCGAKFATGDKAIEDQPQGRVVNPQLADSYNTVLKMAEKRALTAAILNATAASEVFTQDVGEDAEAPVAPPPPADRGGGAPPAPPRPRPDDDIPFTVDAEPFESPTRAQIAELRSLQNAIIKQHGAQMWNVQYAAAFDSVGLSAESDPTKDQAEKILVHLRLVNDPGVGEPA